ncbi:hypothetical protein Tco_0038816 [Tanacetum coccineum]
MVNIAINSDVERLRQDLVLQRPESSNAGRDQNLEGGMRGNLQFSRVTKIEFPKFGGEDVRGWLFKCEQFFKVDYIVENCKDVDRNVYRNAILKRFDVVYDDPLEEVKKLKQTNQVQEYIDDFDRLMFKPRTLTVVYGLCKLEEAKVNALKQKPKPPVLPAPRYQTQFPNTGKKPIALPAPNTNWRTKPVTSTPGAPFRKQLTQKELEEKRARNQFLGDTMPEFVDTELEEEVLSLASGNS